MHRTRNQAKRNKTDEKDQTLGNRQHHVPASWSDLQDVLTCNSFIWSEFIYLDFPPLNVHLKIDFLRSRLHQGADCDCVPEKAHRHTLSLFICPITKVCLTFDPCRQMKLKEEAKELNIFGKVFFCQHCENNCSNLLIYFSSLEPKVVNCFLGLL